MKTIDLSHTISPDMTVYPGTEPPVFFDGTSLAKDGFLEKKITLFTHTGTHMDAPAHILPQGKTLDRFPVGHFCGRAFMLDVSEKGRKKIDVDDLIPHEDKVKGADYIIFKTGWSRFWGEERYFEGFPLLTLEGAKWFDGFNIKGFGFDAISVDRVDSFEMPIHHILLREDRVIIENLTNLEEVEGDSFFFSAFPLKILDADGSPVRAVSSVLET